MSSQIFVKKGKIFCWLSQFGQKGATDPHLCYCTMYIAQCTWKHRIWSRLVRRSQNRRVHHHHQCDCQPFYRRSILVAETAFFSPHHISVNLILHPLIETGCCLWACNVMMHDNLPSNFLNSHSAQCRCATIVDFVDCPTRWSLWYWYLDFYVDHIFPNPNDREI